MTRWVGRKGSYIPATPTGEDTARSFVIPGRYRSWRESTPLCVSRPSPGWTDTGRSEIWTSPGNLRRRRSICLIVFCRFFWFFLYLIDMRNMSKESKMRWALDPRSTKRQTHIDTIPVTCLKPGAVTEVSCTSYLYYGLHTAYSFMHLTLYSITGGSSAGPGEGAGEGAGQCAGEGARAGELQSGDGEVCVHPLWQGVQTARIACKTFKEKPWHQFYRVYLHRLQERYDFKKN